MIYLTPSHLLEYLYCPRFTYFEYVLGIPERQEKRFKVIKGRELHEHRRKINPKYLRKKLGVIKKEQDVELNSANLQIRGIVDEILWLEDETLAPFDYKYAEYKNRLWKTTKVQATIYAMMIQELYDLPVLRAYICFIRSKYKIVEIVFNEKDFIKAKQYIKECFEVIISGYYPNPTNIKKRCNDCTYRNICICS